LNGTVVDGRFCASILIDWMSHLGSFGAIVVRGNICARLGSAEKILSASVSSPLSFPFLLKKGGEKKKSARAVLDLLFLFHRLLNGFTRNR
jgi:hypothetical protein